VDGRAAAGDHPRIRPRELVPAKIVHLEQHGRHLQIPTGARAHARAAERPADGGPHTLRPAVIQKMRPAPQALAGEVPQQPKRDLLPLLQSVDGGAHPQRRGDL
jgi:hypothetical protein